MNELTPAQLKVIQTWTEQRDALMRDIGIYSTELDGLKKATREQGLAFADLEKSIAEARGRIAEIDALETRMRGSLSTDIAELEVRKSRLQSECTALDERLKTGAEKYEIITAAVSQFEVVHATMKDQAAIVNSVVGEIIHTSQVHTSDMKVIMDNIRTIAGDVIAKGNLNIEQSSALMETVPVFVAKLQKSIFAARRYPEGHPKFVATT